VFSFRPGVTPTTSFIVTISVPGIGFGGTSRIFSPSANSSSYDLRYEAFIQRTNGYNSELSINITGINNTTIPVGTRLIVELIVLRQPFERRGRFQRRRGFPFGGEGIGIESEGRCRDEWADWGNDFGAEGGDEWDGGGECWR
jgi:hypothetical protein